MLLTAPDKKEQLENSNCSITNWLNSMNIFPSGKVIINPSYELLHSLETSDNLDDNERGLLTHTDAVCVKTGKFTGRSPKDKYIVYDDQTKNTIWWRSNENGNDNKPISIETWKELKDISTKQLTSGDIFIIDAICGANKKHRLRVRFITQVAWQAHFVKNMFISPERDELRNFNPEFTVLNASRTINDKWQNQGLNSENFIAFNMTERMQLIGGTWYGGEMKKGMFSVMNFFLPQVGVASMHSAANMGKNADVALFFGLSGTGKTTLSTSPDRYLIGDDEHGWGQDGIFNFEGGCYAKTLDLDPIKEPEIYRAIKRNALLENVPLDIKGVPDYHSRVITENGRVSYPLDHIENRVKPTSEAGHASTILFLTADAFGVLPPVSRLSLDQAEYYYLSGFTAKLAGTEIGISKPTPTFSACFGQAFLTLHPTQYSSVLRARMEAYETQAYLINTGWDGSGKRYDLSFTRALVNAILETGLESTSFSKLPYFELWIPNEIPGLDSNLLDPRKSHSHIEVWNDRARDLAALFIKNFTRFADTHEGEKLSQHGPKI